MNPARHLVLVGPMGAGKTSVGRCLARHFELAFVDSDQEIERRTGATVATIFDCEGEAGFRTRERDVLADLLAGPDAVISTGGGAVLDAGTRRNLARGGFVVHLHADVPAQLQRLARDRSRLRAMRRWRRLAATPPRRRPRTPRTGWRPCWSPRGAAARWPRRRGPRRSRRRERAPTHRRRRPGALRHHHRAGPAGGRRCP